eukprot:Amastigsp_a174804_529.p4 type:complete len:120 gc:universal Amastigsp_a174804_529:719-360(-)
MQSPTTMRITAISTPRTIQTHDGVDVHLLSTGTVAETVYPAPTATLAAVKVTRTEDAVAVVTPVGGTMETELASVSESKTRTTLTFGIASVHAAETARHVSLLFLVVLESGPFGTVYER